MLEPAESLDPHPLAAIPAMQHYITGLTEAMRYQFQKLFAMLHDVQETTFQSLLNSTEWLHYSLHSGLDV